MSLGFTTPIVCAAIAAAAGLTATAAPATSGSHDWPQFRGPNRDGISIETGLAPAWPDAGPPELWRVDLGGGYSGLSVWKGHVYTLFSRGTGEFATSIDARTGEPVWKVRIDANRRDRQGNGPRSTPTVSGGIVYVVGASGMLHALRAGSGESLWSHDLSKEYGARLPRWGVATSPLVEGELLILDVGGQDRAGIVAFDRRTGKERWRSLDDKSAYASPIAVSVDGVRQILFFTAASVLGVRPADGTELWRIPWKTSYDVNAAMPVFVAPDRFFVSSGYDVGGAVYRIAVDGQRVEVEQMWKNREMKNQFSSSVLVDGNLYGFDDKTLKCIDAATGERRWAQRGLGHGSLTYADGNLIVLGDRGTLVLVEAKPDAYREKSRTKVFETKTWTVPTLAGGRLYLRDQNELVSLDVAQ